MDSLVNRSDENPPVKNLSTIPNWIGRDSSDVVNFHLRYGIPVLGNSLDWKKKTPTTAAMEPSCQSTTNVAHGS